MSDDKTEDSIEIFPNEIYLSVPIRYLKKMSPKQKQIFLCQEAIEPIILIRDLRLYFTPKDICEYILSFKKYCSQAVLLLSSLTPSFVLVVKTFSINDAKQLMSELVKVPNPICSMDYLGFDFVHSASFKSTKLFSTITSSHDDINCAICLNPCNNKFLLLTLPCGHTFHAKCMTKMSNWECPICRYAPISSLAVACCEICNSFDRPYVCLICARSFCHTHSHQHYEQTGHAYCVSADGRETRNLMSGSSMKRVAQDEDGKLVEMCAKDDLLRNYLEGALEEQLAIHKSLNKQQLKHERDMIKQEEKKLISLIQEKKKEIERKKKLIAEKSIKEKKLKIVQEILQTKRNNFNQLPQTIKELQTENNLLEDQVSQQQDYINDIEATCAISGSVLFKGENEKVCITFNQSKKPESPPSHARQPQKKSKQKK